MRVAIVGGKGSMGRRYASIVKFLGHTPIVLDDPNGIDLDNWAHDRLIVATPTDTHYSYATWAIENDSPVLVEKPLSKSLMECMNLYQEVRGKAKRAYTVCNYKYLCELMNVRKPYSIKYDYYNHGNDSIAWDCCQLLYLDPGATLLTLSPTWHLRINNVLARYRWLEQSYVEMVSDFLGDGVGLWTMADGAEMTRVTLERTQNETKRLNRNSSTISL